MYSVYPWDKWLKPGSRKLKRGKHYECTTRVMAVQIYRMATRRKVTVSVKDSGDSEILLTVNGSKKRRKNAKA